MHRNSEDYNVSVKQDINTDDNTDTQTLWYYPWLKIYSKWRTLICLLIWRKNTQLCSGYKCQSVQSIGVGDYQMLPPACLLNRTLNIGTKSSASPVLSSSYPLKNHPHLPQKGKINTTLVKVDPVKFTLWGLQSGWGSPQGSAQRRGTALQMSAPALNLNLSYSSYAVLF